MPAGHWCECENCGGKLVSRSTWYRHNRTEYRTRKNLRLASSGIGPRRNPSRDAVPGTSTSVDVKEFSPEDLEDGDHRGNIGRAAGLDSVS